MNRRKGNASGGGPEALGGGGETTRQHSNPRSSAVDAFTWLLEEIAAGRYEPRPGSVGEHLLASSDGCGWHARRSLATFARFAVRREGLFWLCLDRPADQVAAADLRAVEWAWREWVEGTNPFRGSRRSVSRAVA